MVKMHKQYNDKDTAAWEMVSHINSIQVSFSAGSQDHTVEINTMVSQFRIFKEMENYW